MPLPSEYSLVGDPSALERTGLFVAEGRIVVQRLLEDGRFRLHSIAVTAPAASALSGVLGARPDVPVHACEAAELRETTGFDFHRGCLALAWRDTREIPLDELVLARRLLAIEGVGNPDNVGGLFRAAFALGVDAVLLDRAAGIRCTGRRSVRRWRPRFGCRSRGRRTGARRSAACARAGIASSR